MKRFKFALPRLCSLLLCGLLLCALGPAARAENAMTVTSQAEWDALFNADGVQTGGTDTVEITGGPITNSHPFTCAQLSISGGDFTTSADITAVVTISGGTMATTNGASVYGNVTLIDGSLSGLSLYGDLYLKGGMINKVPIVHDGTIYNQTIGWVLNYSSSFGIGSNQKAQFTDCTAPALDWAAPDQNGDGRVSWAAVPGAAEYQVNLYKDSVQSAPIASVTTAELSCNFSDAIKASGSGAYYLGAQSIAKAPSRDADGNWQAYWDSVLIFDYATLEYAAPTATPASAALRLWPVWGLTAAAGLGLWAAAKKRAAKN